MGLGNHSRLERHRYLGCTFCVCDPSHKPVARVLHAQTAWPFHVLRRLVYTRTTNCTRLYYSCQRMAALRHIELLNLKTAAILLEHPDDYFLAVGANIDQAINQIVRQEPLLVVPRVSVFGFCPTARL